MTLGRLLSLLIVLALGWWVVTKSGWLGHKETHETAVPNARGPIERARDAARANASRGAERAAAQSEADSPAPAGAITENMTPDQVRALLGPPVEIQIETTDSGARREKWIYSSVGKTVVFENGVAVSVQ